MALLAAIALVVLPVLAYRTAHAAIWPWRPCFACQGRRGHGPGSTHEAWNECWACGGSGRQLRFLAHLTRRDLVRRQKARR